MKIVFINPATDRFSEYNSWSTGVINKIMDRHMITLPKMSVMIFAALTPQEHSFTFIDEEFEDVDFDMECDLVAISTMTVQAPRTYEIAEEFRKRSKKVVIGGIHASVRTEEVKANCDAVMVGEGENTWPDMIKDLEKGRLKEIYDAKDYPPVETFTRPKPDVIKHEHYLMYPIQATKGCPNDCEFCSIKYSSGHRYRMKPIEQVIEEIQLFETYNNSNNNSIGFKKTYQFVDDNLYVNREYTKKLFTAMKGLGISWSGQGTLNTAFDDEILELMADSGCKGYHIGFESISPESLKEANKPAFNKVAEYAEAAENIIRHGIVPAGYFIFGFNSDDVTAFERTVNFTKKYHIMQPFFNVLTPYPGTRLYDKMEAEGVIFDRDWRHYNSITCVYTPRNITPEEMKAGIRWSLANFGSMDNIREQLDYFWSHGPWKSNPALTVKERLGLMALGLKLHKHKTYRDFLFWVAWHKKAAGIGIVVAALYFSGLTSQLTDTVNPAEAS
jgi:radical SAM superfamily enzyme YgiQ (UPF0313 family)